MKTTHGGSNHQAPIFIGLCAAVPLRIVEYQQRGGPTEQEFADAKKFGSVLAERADVLMYGGKPGEAATLFNGLVLSLATMAFVPGGVTFAGQKWEAKPSGRAK